MLTFWMVLSHTVSWHLVLFLFFYHKSLNYTVIASQLFASKFVLEASESLIQERPQDEEIVGF